MRSLVGLYLPLFCVVDLETTNGLMRAAGELMMISRLLIVPGVEHAVQIVAVDLSMLLLRPRESMVLHGSHIMNAPGILRSTPSVHISGGRHLGSIFAVKQSILALRGPGGGLLVTPAEKASLQGSQFDSKQCRGSFR